ncbi:Uma2 family endonuclease [Gemmata sp. JC673]|uniref:Uma2 family endonuclease n=1 Tax=Gemmata algarum TaxID=2975278 RepID=A0ABU5EY10_9BACT|nr:Uma2 family endonuclease [Gemmata algarum]MDY3559823.1 Uma2 family endonuclease [Gemmata algarum]
MSTATLPAAPRRTPPHRWTVPEFHRLCSLGMFAGRRPVLLNGVILEQGPMDSPHGNGVERTDTVVRAAFGAGWRFRVQLPLVLSLHTDPMPDIAVVAGALAGNPGHPTTAALVIEVADTTFDTDTTEKAELYATAGIADYWVLDVDNRELHVFRAPRPSASLGVTAYYTHSVLKPGDTVSPLAVPGVAVRVADLLP